MKNIFCDATLRTVALKDGDFELSIPVETSDILHNELLAILVAVKYAHHQKGEVHIYTDNIIAFRILDDPKIYKERNIKNEATRKLITELRYFFYEAPTSASLVTLNYIKGKENQADRISRKVITQDWHKHLFLYC
jgi:hypothetical protein